MDRKNRPLNRKKDQKKERQIDGLRDRSMNRKTDRKIERQING